MATDLSYTLPADGVYEVPFTVQGSCAGRQLLLQRAIVMMMTGTSDPLRYEGGNLIAALKGANLSRNDLERIRNVLKIAVANTAEAIKTAQASAANLADDEKLASMTLGEVSLNGTDGLNVTFSVVSVTGEASTTAFTLGL